MTQLTFITLALLSTFATALEFGNGIKIGELTSTSVTIWVRTTKEAEAQNKVMEWDYFEPNWTLEGQPAEVSFTLYKQDEIEKRLSENPNDSVGLLKGLKGIETGYQTTSAETNFTTQFAITGLEPATEYRVYSKSFSYAEQTVKIGFLPDFSITTPPNKETARPITFTVSTCQEFELRDEPAKGHKIYQSMLQLEPDFFIQTGDTIYYDRKEPRAKTKELARYRWNRMYALPYQRDFHNRIPTYWMHDDHDLLKDDCEPGDQYGDLSWQDGIDLWNENVPQAKKPYRTVRWGKDLQIWLPEVRYFRSPKKMEDGPEKSILGKEQWDWLEKSMKESDATFKLYVSPTPVVGPDRAKKNDNHANIGFQHEGERLRKFLASIPGVFVINGDRHWQYHSIDPVTKLQEFGAGPASDAHAQGWKQDDKRPEHQFLRVQGGFISGKVEGKTLTLTHRDVDGKVTNETVLTR